MNSFDVRSSWWFVGDAVPVMTAIGWLWNPTSQKASVTTRLAAIAAGIAMLRLVGLPAPANCQEMPRAELVQSTWHVGADNYDAIAGQFSKDGRLFLTGGRDRSARLWDVASGRKVRQFGPHPGPVNAVAISPGGKVVATASGGFDHSLRTWDIATGRLLKEFKGHPNADALEFIGNGETIAVAEDEFVKVIDASTGAERRRFKLRESSLSRSSLLIEGKRLAVLKEGNVQMWDLETGRETTRLKAKESDQLASHGGEPVILAHAKARGAIVIKRVKDAAEVGRIPVGTAWSGIFKVTPVSKHILTLSAAYGPGIIQIWDFAGRELRKISHTKGMLLEGAVFCSDGRMAAVHDASWGWHVVDLDQGTVVSRLGMASSPIQDFAMLPDGGGVFVTDGVGARRWNLANGRQTSFFPIDYVPSGFVVRTRAAIVPDGKFAVLAATWNVDLFDMETQRRVKSLSNEEKHLVDVVALSPDGKQAFVAFSGGSVSEYDLQSWRDQGQKAISPGRQVFKTPGGLTSMSISPNGDKMATGDTVWDIASGRKLAAFGVEYSSNGTSSRFSPDGRTILVASPDNTAQLFDVASGQRLQRFEGHDYFLTSLAFSRDGRTVLTGSADSSARLWDIASGLQLARLQGHNGRVVGVGYSPGGQSVVTAGNDGSVKVWDAATGQLRASMLGFVDGSWLTVTPEGFFDQSSPEAARNLSIVRGMEASSVDQVYNALYRPDLVKEKLAGDPDGKVKAAVARLDLDKIMASGSSPKVAITAPASGLPAASDQVAIEAEVTDQGGGIGKVEWRVNGVTVGTGTRGFERVAAVAGQQPVSGKPRTIRQSLSLVPGDNHVELVVYNARDLIASETARITVKWDGESGSTPPRLFVLAVGVNDYYDSRLRLSYAVPDATALAEGFRKAATGLYAGVDVTTVLDKDVTIANLDRVFTELGSKANPRDVFVFFLAGHGKTKNGKYYFLPRDFRYEDETSIEKTAMDQDRFQDWFARIPARKSMLLYDTCESGSLTGNAARGSDIEERLGALNRLTRATGRTFLTATTDDAPALEGYRGHGVFTYAILDALEHADVNRNGLIEVSELADYIDQKVPDFSFEAFKLRQIPQRSIVGNNFALTNKVAVLTAGNPPAAANDRAKDNSAVQPGAASAVPARPTHVVISPADVFEGLEGKGARLERLPAGTLLSLVKTGQGWILVARDGKSLGYVAEDRLMRVQ